MRVAPGLIIHKYMGETRATHARARYPSGERPAKPLCAGSPQGRASDSVNDNSGPLLLRGSGFFRSGLGAIHSAFRRVLCLGRGFPRAAFG